MIFAATHIAIVANRILIVGDRRDSVNRAVESSLSSADRRITATNLSRSRYCESAAIDAALQIQNVHRDRIDLGRRQTYGLTGISSPGKQRGRSRPIRTSQKSLNRWGAHYASRA